MTMSMKTALHEHIERLTDADAERLLSSLRGYSGDQTALEIARRVERARNGFWRDDFESDDAYRSAMLQGVADLVGLLQTAELELACEVWRLPMDGHSSLRMALCDFAARSDSETLAHLMDYLNNRLDPDELTEQEQALLHDHLA